MPAEERTSDIELPPIGTYQYGPVACYAYDPRAPDVARRVAQMITTRLPMLRVDHVGSTSVPGCAGKGIVDLVVIYPDGALEQAKRVLDDLGFQHQQAGHMFPETRPMRIGALRYDGDMFRIHAHVLSEHSPEIDSMRAFRDRLRGDPQLMAGYVARKYAIISAGVSEPAEYTRLKSEFFTEAER